MISKSTLDTLTSYGPKDLARLLDECGYSGASFSDVEFLGLGSAYEFVYRVWYPDEDGEGEAMGQVYVTCDPLSGVIGADY